VSLEIIFAPRAALHVETLDAWWRENRTEAPELFREELAAALQTIAEAPTLGRRYTTIGEREVRRTLLRTARILFNYPVDTETVSIVAVWGAIKSRGPDLSGI